MNLLRAASTISLLTLVSRISGLARDVAVSNAFGASAWMDAFNVAFRIPNFLRRLFGEGAFQQAFVPILGETLARDGEAATGALIDAVATILFWALMLTCVVGVVAAPVMVFLMASGLKEFDGAVLMTRVMFPYIGLISMVSLAAGILNTWKRFVVPAATPVLLNLASIAAALWLGPLFQRWGIQPIYAQAVGVMVGGIVQLAIQFPVLRRIGVLPHIGLLPGKIRAAWSHPGVAPRAAPDGAGAGRRVGGAGLDPDQHADRDAPGRRRGLVARLGEPADGVPDRAAGRRAGRRADPAALGRERAQGCGGLLRPARLGLAPGDAAGAAVLGRAAGVPERADLGAVPPRRVRCARGAASRPAR